MTQPQPQWVRLFLVPQTDQLNTMPPSVVGLLTSETGSSYVLNPMLEEQTDEDTFESVYVQSGMNFISKTYVWRCQILEHKPDIMEGAQDKEEDAEELGELG